MILLYHEEHIGPEKTACVKPQGMPILSPSVASHPKRRHDPDVNRRREASHGESGFQVC